MNQTNDKEKLTEFEKKWGKVCPICKIRKGSFTATSKSEGGRDSICKCDDNKEGRS